MLLTACPRQVLKIKKPESGADLSFLVACADGSQTIVSNSLLRAEAPLLLVDFYQASALAATLFVMPQLHV